MSPRWALHSLRWSYCAFIAAASLIAAQTALRGHGEGSHGAHLVLALAAAELFAALAFALEPAELIAGAGLLLVYAIAGTISILSADWLAVLRFIFYGATVAYIVVAHRNLVARPK